MTEAIMMKTIETSIIAFAFLWLLKNFLTDNKNGMKMIAEELSSVTKVLSQISGTLVKMDSRIEKLEREMDAVRRGGDVNG